MKQKHPLFSLIAAAISFSAAATPVEVVMNTVSQTMTLQDETSGSAVNIGEPAGRTYTFDVAPGRYLLTGFTSNKTNNGTIVLNIPDSNEKQLFEILTCTVYATNKDAANKAWTVENGDYTIATEVTASDGEKLKIALGKSTTAGRYTFLAMKGCSYKASFIPSAAHVQEGYTTFLKMATLTANATISGAIPLTSTLDITIPADAHFSLGIKFTHFTDFTTVTPVSEKTQGSDKVLSYNLAQNQVYNFRTWKEDAMTLAGQFTMKADAKPLIFTADDYTANNPKQINHDPKSNSGYETGDIFVNINAAGHLSLVKGQEFDAHAMRSWQLTDSAVGNYFIEPDFHYTILDLGGKPSTGVIEIDNADTTTSAWSKIKAVGKGTAIVLVTYDAINLNIYDIVAGTKKNFMGGEFWGAIWPENTGVYVVTVDEPASSVVPEMTIHEDLNSETYKLAGKYVDAEHDVFYYADTEPGATYTFKPRNVKEIKIAYPEVGNQTVSFKGFSTDGIIHNEDGSYTLLLKQGRQIVKFTDNAGNASYQVLTARVCHREITNKNEDSKKGVRPGDVLDVKYSGLYHPANKLAGIYNMSCYVVYNDVTNGDAIILSPNQYTFGSSEKAQTFSITIPEDFDFNTTPEYVVSDGMLQITGYGDPIGNHRYINPVIGRSPNFTAIAHKTYFGQVPELRIRVSDKWYDISVNCNVEDATINIEFEGTNLIADENGIYTGTYGTYTVTAKAAGYYDCQKTFKISKDTPESTPQVFDIAMEEDKTDSVTSVAAETIVEYYDLQGRKVTNPANGLYIVKFSDGRVAKIFVK